VYSCESSVLGDILRNELGFRGFMMTDWFASAKASLATAASVDLVMPGDIGLLSMEADTLDVTVGNETTTLLDQMVIHIIATWYKMGQDQDYPDINYSTLTKDTDGILLDTGHIGKVNYHVNVQGDHASLIREIAGEGAVLLVNHGVLPLKDIASLGVFGSDGGPNPDGLNSCGEFDSCNKGTLACGWGSGSGTFPYLSVSPMMRLTFSYTGRRARNKSDFCWIQDKPSNQRL
jgi:beta-glucosidase-like glycosyl hydrolase